MIVMKNLDREDVVLEEVAKTSVVMKTCDQPEFHLVTIVVISRIFSIISKFYANLMSILCQNADNK